MKKNQIWKRFLFPILLSCVILCVVMIFYWLRSLQETEMFELEKGAPSPRTIRVYIGGEVVNPGMVEMPEGSLLNDCILASGGFTGIASPTINLAFPVKDNMTVLIHAAGKIILEGVGDAVVIKDGKILDGKIDINRADLELLCMLPGIGEITANRILAYRLEHGPFQVIEDIMKVPGIKQGKFSAIQELITAR